MKEPKLTLVGAGPSDPELITLKALRMLSTADVVLYDALVSADILQLIPTGIPSFCVGKRAGQHSYSQEEINELIVQFAQQYGHVVRLKGGDPFVFGRGSEEIEYAEANGVCASVVPGISSALAVPASVGIPVTARGISESIWIVTGTTQNRSFSNDLKLAAQSSATVVILMGLNNIEEIVQQFLCAGKDDVPVAIIQNGTLPTQMSVVGNISSIALLAKQSGISSPAVIVVGEVVRYASSLREVMQSVKSMA